jgi:hypothetical protein
MAVYGVLLEKIRWHGGRETDDPALARERIMTAMTAAILLFAGYGAIGTFDVLYYHLHRFRLYERPESYGEHLLHTANVLLTPLVVAGLYVGRTGGLTLWLATGVAAGQVVVLLWDVLVEHDSRAQLGGLPRPEYFIHIVVVMMHAASLALVLVDRPAIAWGLNAPMLLEPIKWDAWRGAMVTLGALAVPLGILHVALALRGYQSIQARRPGASLAAVGSSATG